MKYFSLSTVKKAYDSISLTTKDKFWGILGIFYSVDSLVKPNLNYAIDTPKLSNFLENIFRFKNKKSYDEYDSSYSVVFANNWESKVSEYFLIGRPNLLPIIVWAYRNTVFEYEYTVEDLLEKFVNDFHLSKENIENLFNISRSDFELEYVDFLYDDSILLRDLGVVSSDATTLKMNKSFVVANAGDLSRGPFFQPLYASLNTIECLIIFPFKNTDYYHLFTPFLSDVDVNNQTSIEDEYIEFLKITTPKSVSNYSSSSFGRIGRTLKSIFKTDKDVSIYSYTTVEAVKQIIDILQSNREFLEYNETGRRQYSTALDWYLKFLMLRSMFSNIRDMQVKNNQDLSDKPLQQIYYGAPGTGKSHETNKIVSEYSDTIRTTFHPDSDYSTFVGAYKPTTEKEYMYGLNGNMTVLFEDPITKKPLQTSKIEYKFVKQAFLKAYIRAWLKMSKSMSLNGDGNIPPQFLVIEERNRGNCAQIFGDIFQLLDRKEGYSEYPIEADDDIRKALIEDKPTDGLSFGSEGLQLPEEIKCQINEICGDDEVADKVCNGEVLVLPPNLYIWATMNTSDQSLFPIDSAFKRRWDWQYMPIKNAGEGWVIEVKDENGTKKYDWWEFIKKINAEIDDLTSSEDKKLGYFFCKAKNKVVSADMFVNKVMFYLWNDVVKDYDLSGREAFQDDDGKVLIFGKFYENKVRAIEKLMENLKVTGVRENGSVEEEKEDLTEDEIVQNNSDATQYLVNGKNVGGKCSVAYEAISSFVVNNPNYTLDQIIEFWRNLGVKHLPHLVETEEEFQNRKATSKDKRFDTKSKRLEVEGKVLFVSNQFTPERIEDFIDKVHAQDWGIKIEKVQ